MAFSIILFWGGVDFFEGKVKGLETSVCVGEGVGLDGEGVDDWGGGGRGGEGCGAGEVVALDLK